MNSETVPADLEQIRAELETWRGQRRKGERIPEELWQRAADAVRVHGLNAVSCTLRLDYYQLKRRAGQDCPVRPATPAFVELGGAAPETGPEPGLEFGPMAHGAAGPVHRLDAQRPPDATCICWPIIPVF